MKISKNTKKIAIISGSALAVIAGGILIWNSTPVLISRAVKKTGASKDEMKSKTKDELMAIIKAGSYTPPIKEGDVGKFELVVIGNEPLPSAITYAGFKVGNQLDGTIVAEIKPAGVTSVKTGRIGLKRDKGDGSFVFIPVENLKKV